MNSPPPKPSRTLRPNSVQSLLFSRFAGPSSKSSLDHTASPLQSQWKLPSVKNSSQIDTTNKPFHFFDLPPEIRNMVYYFFFPQDIVICGDEKPLRKFWRGDLVLFSVSRQVREESRRMLYVDSTIHINLEEISSYRTFLAWINMVEQADVRRIKELKIYAWMEVYRTLDFVTIFRNRCYHIRLQDGIQLAENLATILFSAVSPRGGHCRTCRTRGYSLDMFQELLHELGWDYSRFRVKDIKAMVNGLFQYSSLYKATHPPRHLLDSPAKVSLIDSFAYPKNSTEYMGII